MYNENQMSDTFEVVRQLLTRIHRSQMSDTFEVSDIS